MKFASKNTMAYAGLQGDRCHTEYAPMIRAAQSVALNDYAGNLDRPIEC